MYAFLVSWMHVPIGDIDVRVNPVAHGPVEKIVISLKTKEKNNINNPC